MNHYYGVKDQECNFSYTNARWLTPDELKSTLNLTNEWMIRVEDLVHPNELIFSVHNGTLVDVLLLARESHGRLRSVLLSRLFSQPQRLLILSLPKGTYDWCDVRRVNVIPTNALRFGYDVVNRQFAYIGRLRLNSPLAGINPSPLGPDNHLFGRLINNYESIPAIVMGLNSPTDLASSLDVNLTRTNYQVLCLKKQPPKLTQLCSRILVDHRERLGQLSGSLRDLVWPNCLRPGECVVKQGLMRSLNGRYELTVTSTGLFQLRHGDEMITVEKNIDSLLVLPTGVYLIYDNNQPARKPKVVYNHLKRAGAYRLELTDDGRVRVTFALESADLFAIDELLESARPGRKSTLMISLTPLHRPPPVGKLKSFTINVRLSLAPFRQLPVRLFHLVVDVVKRVTRRFTSTRNYHFN